MFAALAGIEVFAGGGVLQIPVMLTVAPGIATLEVPFMRIVLPLITVGSR